MGTLRDGRLVSRSALAVLLSLCAVLAGCATTPKDADSAAAPSITTAAGALQAGDEAARRGDFQTALAHYVRAVGIEASVDGWLRVGAVYTRLDQRQRALAAYLKVLELDPNQIDARESVGLEYLALGDHEAAKTHLTSVVDVEPQRWRARNGLGIAADRAGDHALAIEHYLAALDLAPDSPMILNNLGYSRYLSDDFEQAARDFFRAAQIQPDYTPAWANLGMLYARRGWYDEAVRTLTRAMDGAKAHNDVGYIAYRNGDLQESEQLLSEAVRLSPMYYRAAYQNLDLVRARMRGGSDSAPLTGAPERAGWDAGE